MEKFASENLILLEFLVDNVSFEYSMQESLKCMPGETCVAFQFLDNMPIYVCEEDFAPQSRTYGDGCGGCSSLKNGKSCLFALSGEQAKACMQQFDIYVEVFRRMADGVTPEKVVLGESLVSILSLFQQLVHTYNANEADEPVAKTLKDCFKIETTTGELVGRIGVYLRMSTFGKLIVTKFRMNMQDKSVEFKAREGHYRFASKANDLEVKKNQKYVTGSLSEKNVYDIPCGKPKETPRHPCATEPVHCPIDPPAPGPQPTMGFPANVAPPQYGQYTAQPTECGCPITSYPEGRAAYTPQPTECGFPTTSYPESRTAYPAQPTERGFPTQPYPAKTAPYTSQPTQYGFPTTSYPEGRAAYTAQPTERRFPTQPYPAKMAPYTAQPTECGFPTQPYPASRAAELPAVPPPPDCDYQEFSAEMGGNSLTIRVHKDKATVEQNADEVCCCDGGKPKPAVYQVPPPSPCSCVNAQTGSGGSDGAHKSGVCPSCCPDNGQPFTFKMGGTTQVSNNISLVSPTCAQPKDATLGPLADPTKEVFILRIGKKNESATKKNTMEIELCTPKGKEYKPPAKKMDTEQQCDSTESKPDGKKGKGKDKKGGGKKGKK